MAFIDFGVEYYRVTVANFKGDAYTLQGNMRDRFQRLPRFRPSRNDLTFETGRRRWLILWDAVDVNLRSSP